MSQENVDLFRAALDDFLGGTSESEREGMLARIAAVWHPEIEWDVSEMNLPDAGGGIYRGKDAVSRFWREWLGAWETTKFDYELLDAGDRVVVLLDQHLRGRSTGLEMHLGRFAEVVTFRDGLVIHFKLYRSQRRALAAAGLSE
jgi:hypothetical protein